MRVLRLNPFARELAQLLQTLVKGQCLTKPVLYPAEVWRANNFRFFASSSAFMSATAQLQSRESTWYTLNILSDEQPITTLLLHKIILLQDYQGIKKSFMVAKLALKSFIETLFVFILSCFGFT